MAGVAQVAIVGALDPLNVSFPEQRRRTFDPQETFVVAVALWLVSERSDSTTRRLTENYSANPAVGLSAHRGQQYPGYLPSGTTMT